MAIVLVIIFLVIGMITQGSDKEKGCGWTIVGCVAFLWFLIQLGISSDDAANIFLYVIGIGIVLFILWGVSKTKKNHDSNSTTFVESTSKIEHNQINYNEIGKSIGNEKLLIFESEESEAFLKKDDELLNFTKDINKDENYKEKSESYEGYQRLVNCIANYNITNNLIQAEKNKDLEVLRYPEKAEERLYDKKIKAMAEELHNCDSLDDIIDTYMMNRNESEIFNPASLGLLRGYVVRNTLNNKEHVSSIEIRRLVENKSNNYHDKINNAEQLSVTQKKEKIVINTSDEEKAKYNLELVVDDCKNEAYRDIQNIENWLKRPENENEGNLDKNNYLDVIEILNENHEEKFELIEIGITPEHVEKDNLYKSEKIVMNENIIESSENAKMDDSKKRMLHLYECEFYDFNQNIHEYINNLERLEKDKIVYEEPDTNITRSKKSIKEFKFEEKLLKISQLETNLDENSYQFKRFMNDKVSGDLRAIDFLSNEYSDFTQGYIVWINLINKGKLFFPKSSTYANVVMYQIINRLIVNNPNWALIIMIDLWNHYYPNFQHKETLMWIKDFWVTYCEDISYSEFNIMFKYQIEFHGDRVMDSIDNIDVSYLSKNKFLDFFNENCNYKIKTGRTVQEGHEDLLELCLRETMSRLQMLFNEHEIKLEDYFQIYEEEEVEKKRDPFRRAIITNQTINYISSNVNNREVGSYEIYNVDANSKDIKFLIKRKRYTYFKSRLFIENIGKVCELYLRDWLGIPAKFIVNIEELCEIIPGLNNFENKDNNEIIKKIREAVEFVCRSNEVQQSKDAKTNINYLRDNKSKSSKNNDVKMNEKQLFDVDVSKLDKIRRDAELIQDKLLVDDEGAFQAEEINTIQEQERPYVITQISHSQNTENDEWQDLFANLLPYELQALSIIFNQGDANSKLEELCKKSGLLLEVILEGINEKALEIMGDNIIESRNDIPIIFQDYISDIGKILQEEK